MKKVNKLVLTALAGLMLVYSCKDSFLDVPVTGQLNQGILAGQLGLDASLLAVYSQVNGRANRMASPSNWVWGSIRGADANKGTDPGDFSTINPVQRYAALPTGDVIADKWNGNFEGVARANATLKLLANADPEVTADFKKGIDAQARFLRAHFYFELTRGYHKVPYVDETIDYGSGIELVKNDVEIWDKIVADMKIAVANLPETQGEVGRVNSWAAKAYLAKIYMYMASPGYNAGAGVNPQEYYDLAKGLFDEIILKGKTSNGKKYELVRSFPDVFKASNDNHEESIWAYQSAANTGSVNNANPEFDLNWPYNTGPAGPGNCCSFFQPTFESANWFRTTGAGLPYVAVDLDDDYNAHPLVTDMGKESADAFAPDAGPLDPRIDHSIGRRGIPYLDWQDFPGKSWIRNQPNAGPYETKKFVYYQADKGSLQDNSSWTPGYTAINFPIIRFADILLLAAEAELEATTGTAAQAKIYVNRVRARARASKLQKDGSDAANYALMALYDDADNWLKGDPLTKAKVRFERQLELHSEGHRFYDLVRWGIADVVLNKFITYEAPLYGLGALNDAKFDKGIDEYLPIPQAQLDLLNSTEVILTQNPGF
jgi:hypothetical protein